MATKKIEPTNPDKNTPAEAADDKNADRKTNGIRHSGRKSGRKTNGFARGFSDRAMKCGIVPVEW